MPSGTVMVVDDEAMVRETVGSYLEQQGFEVVAVDDGDRALRLLHNELPDLVVLDVMLPGRNGLEVLASLREFSDVPVILLTARTEEMDRIQGLELGADDYVVKPFSPREVVARVRTVLKRTQPDEAEPMVFGELAIDPVTREVTLDGDLVELTRREYEMLAFLAAAPRQVFSRAQLLQHVWGSSPEWQDPSTVTVHVRRLRQKVERDAEEPRWIQTVWGVGYRFEP